MPASKWHLVCHERGTTEQASQALGSLHLLPLKPISLVYTTSRLPLPLSSRDWGVVAVLAERTICGGKRLPKGGWDGVWQDGRDGDPDWLTRNQQLRLVGT